MTIRKRTITLTSNGSGAASGELGLGCKYGRIFKVEFKGDDADVDTNNTLAITDNAGRAVLAATAFDGGTDDSTAKKTEQSFSTVGVGFYLGPVESDVYDAGGDASANTEGQAIGVLAESPVTIAIASGTEGDVHRIHLFVEE